MDQVKIGKFIATRRKLKSMTQLQLAEQLGITDRAVSKWETGKAMPDSSCMLELCRLLDITATDLLFGEVVTMQNEASEAILLDMVKQKEASDKRLLFLEIVIGFLSVTFLLTLCFLASFLPMEDWLRIVLIVAGFVVGLAGFMVALRLEQVAGYYQCGKCGHKYVPSFAATLWAMHFGRTRFMKCPECHKHSWQKKVISKD